MENENTNTELNVEGGTEKTFTEQEVADLLQRETDRRVSSALAKQKKEFDKQLSLSKLDGAEREKAEKDARIAELEQQLSNFQLEKNRSELKSVLSSRGLSAEFADIIAITDDLEESQAKLEKLDKIFKAAVQDEVKRRLNTTNVSVGTGTENGGIDFAHMSLADKNNLYKTNPDLFKALSGT